MRPSDPLSDHLLVQWLLESVQFWISASILLMGLVISKTQSSPVGLWHLPPLLLSTPQTVQHTHSHCYLSVWRKDPGGAFAWSLFSSLLSGLHWVLGCMMLFSSFFWVFFNCVLESRLMFWSIHSTLKISQWQEVGLWYHHGNIEVGVG